MEWIIRFNGIQLVSNIQPFSIYDGVITFADGSHFNVNTGLLNIVVQGVHVEILSEQDPRRLADDDTSSPNRPIIDMVDHGGGTCVISSHEGTFAITSYGEIVTNITGQDNIQFGSGNHMSL